MLLCLLDAGQFTPRSFCPPATHYAEYVLFVYVQLLVLDLLTNRIVRIPTLRSSPHRLPCECPCGIHSLSVNPSHTLLATGGDNVNDVAIYRLPTFDPVCVGEVCYHVIVPVLY